MCGRFGFSLPPARAAEYFGWAPPGAEDLGSAAFLPRDNIPPGTDIAAARMEAGGPALCALRWGLVPHWARDRASGNGPGRPLINARGETVHEKPSFRDAFRRRRCLIPAELFYEWAEARPKRIPHAFCLADGAPFAMAGLWEAWADPATGGVLRTCCIVTTAANALVGGIHDRMPVILDAAGREVWLAPNAQPAALRALLAPYAGSMAVERLAPGSV